MSQLQLHPQWSVDDRANTRAFFDSPTGQRLIETLWLNRPALKTETAERAGGWEEATNFLSWLTAAKLQHELGAEEFTQIDTSELRGRVPFDQRKKA